MEQQPIVDLDALPDPRVPQANPLPLQQIRAGLAYHEASHAVIGMTRGMSLQRTRVYQVPDPALNLWTGTTTWAVSWVLEFNFACQCAAGSVGELRYLKESGLLTSATAACALAPHDRAAAETALASVGYRIASEGPAPENGATWDEILDATHTAVDEHWPQITELATAILAAPGYTVTGAHAAAITGIPNPTPSRPHH